MTLRIAGFCLLVMLPVAALAAALPEAQPPSAAPSPVEPAPSVSDWLLPPTAPPAAPGTVTPPPAAHTPAALTPPVSRSPVAPSAAAAKGAASASWESYRVLSERNIFLRNRSRYSGGYRGSSGPSLSTPAVSSSDSSLVLTGIIQQGEDCMAFFEDTRTGKTLTLRVGEALGRGRLSMITPDVVHYAYDGDIKRIEIGSSLAGTAVAFARPAAAAASTSTSTSPAAATSALPAGAVPGMPPGPPQAGLFGGAVAGPPAAMPLGPGTAVMPNGAGGVVLQLAPTVAGTPAPQPAAAPPPAAASPPSSVGGSATIEERMRQRREQELNK